MYVFQISFKKEAAVYMLKKKCIFIFLTAVFILVIFVSGHNIFKNTALAFMPLGNFTVVIDAGHGGWDPGKTGKNGLNEKDINLDIAQKTADFLEEAGADVYITRTSDSALGENKRSDMKKRIDIIENSKADIMISIHQNSYPSEKAKGAQVFYFRKSENGHLLADCIQKSLIQCLDEKNTRTAKENNNYYVLKNTDIPSVIIECGFLSNPEEERLLNTEEYRLKTAWAIFDGILTYFEKD